MSTKNLREQKLNLHGYSERDFMIICSRNIIMKVREEQDHLLVQYGDNLGSVLIAYLFQQTPGNLELIYRNNFDFNILEVENFGLKTFKMKFEYFH
jgi:hypothetical protein